MIKMEVTATKLANFYLVMIKANKCYTYLHHLHLQQMKLIKVARGPAL